MHHVTRSSGRQLRQHGRQVHAGTRVSVAQFEHQLLLLLTELLVDDHLPLQRHLQVLLLPRQLPAKQTGSDVGSRASDCEVRLWPAGGDKAAACGATITTLPATMTGAYY